MPVNYQSYSRILVEIDLPKCENTYGVAPCTASVPTTGTDKCFNCIRTCQDRLNYSEGTLTLRLADQAPDDYYTVADTPVPVVNNITGISITPAVVRPGVDAGERETLNINCREHADSDAQLDPYVTERAYDPYEQGTFWQRLRSRYVSWEGFPLRLYRGYAGQDRDDMDVYHYAVSGVTSNGTSARITAKDPFTLADSKRSQAPVLSNGLIFADLSDSATSFTLVPTGVGDSEYPATGKVCLSGKEVCVFTRSGDTMTIVRGSAAQEHAANSTAQLVLSYVGVSGAAILADLLTNYAEGIEAAWVDAAAWAAEIDTYYGTVFTADITAPTAVSKLCNELIAQLPAVFWWDSRGQRFMLQALRPADPAAPHVDSNSFVEDSFRVSEQPDARADTIWTYFGQVDATKKLDEVNNYATTLATVDPNSAVDYNTNAIKTVYSRWIPAVARGTAQVLNATLLSRYRDPPRQVNFALWRNVVRKPSLGDVYYVTHPYIQDIYGQQVTIPVQLCTVKADDSTHLCSGQEVVYVPQTADAQQGRRYIYVDHDIVDVNLRALYDTVFSNLTGVTEVHLVIGAGAAVGGSVSSGYALTILDADWPGAIDIFIDLVGGMVLGKGGDGLPGVVVPSAGAPAPAGHALLIDRPVTVTGTGIIGGGGGAGARWVRTIANFQARVGGAGGAGWNIGVTGAFSGDPANTMTLQITTQATKTEGGWQGYTSNTGPYGVGGGDLGQPGDDPSGYGFNDYGPVGQPGHAVDGYSNLTIVGGGVDIRGTTT